MYETTTAALRKLSAENKSPRDCIDDAADAIEKLVSTVDFLWSILDDIDTASDIAKFDDRWYRQRVEFLQAKRHERVTSDGYTLAMVHNAK